jgi:hypothetical protein
MSDSTRRVGILHPQIRGCFSSKGSFSTATPDFDNNRDSRFDSQCSPSPKRSCGVAWNNKLTVRSHLEDYAVSVFSAKGNRAVEVSRAVKVTACP